jgi:hydroxymethylpyrimidine/phosphomethylpyrimidine kinase
MTTTTALTAQNTLGVVDIHNTPPDFVKRSIDTCLSDIKCDVVKTGMESRFSNILDRMSMLRNEL